MQLVPAWQRVVKQRVQRRALRTPRREHLRARFGAVPEQVDEPAVEVAHGDRQAIAEQADAELLQHARRPALVLADRFERSGVALQALDGALDLPFEREQHLAERAVAPRASSPQKRLRRQADRRGVALQRGVNAVVLVDDPVLVLAKVAPHQRVERHGRALVGLEERREPVGARLAQVVRVRFPMPAGEKPELVRVDGVAELVRHRASPALVAQAVHNRGGPFRDRRRIDFLGALGPIGPGHDVRLTARRAAVHHLAPELPSVLAEYPEHASA